MKVNLKKTGVIILAGAIGLVLGTKYGNARYSKDEYDVVIEEDNQDTIEEVIVEEKIPLSYDVNNPVVKSYGYANDNIVIYEDEEKTILKTTIDNYQLVEIYDENDETILGKVNDTVGYMNKCDVSALEDIFVVVDISSQELKLYNGTETILSTPVVTGTPTKDRHTEIGCFEVYEKTNGRWLKNRDGSDNVWVDTMMKFNGNQGLHDAERVTGHNDYDKSHHRTITHHGWRDSSEFGGDTYLTNGSHGCVNMPNEAAMETKKYVEEGTKVLVKE